MDSELYKDSVEYEKLTQVIYQSILNNEGLERISVQHDEDLIGRSGVAHQIDVCWKFKQANIEHAVLIECKNYSTALTLEKIRNFHSVINDIGNCKGIMVTKVGFQSGAKKYADFYGIDLKLMRKPIEEDWKDKIKDIHINIIAKAPVSSSDKPISLSLVIAPETEEQRELIEKLQAENKLTIPSGPDMRFVDNSRVPITDEMRWWLPKQLQVLDKEPGGPYEQTIKLENAFIITNPEEDSEQLVKVKLVKVTYWVEELDTREIIIHGDEVVQAILKDFSTGDTEYVKHKKG